MNHSISLLLCYESLYSRGNFRGTSASFFPWHFARQVVYSAFALLLQLIIMVEQKKTKKKNERKKRKQLVCMIRFATFIVQSVRVIWIRLTFTLSHRTTRRSSYHHHHHHRSTFVSPFQAVQQLWLILSSMECSIWEGQGTQNFNIPRWCSLRRHFENQPNLSRIKSLARWIIANWPSAENVVPLRALATDGKGISQTKLASINVTLLYRWILTNRYRFGYCSTYIYSHKWTKYIIAKYSKTAILGSAVFTESAIISLVEKGCLHVKKGWCIDLMACEREWRNSTLTIVWVIA